MTYEIIALSKRAKDITGQTFGRLTAIAPVGRNKHKSILWLCTCECRATSVVSCSTLTSGNTKSCGCYKSQLQMVSKRKHGLHGTPEHKAWSHMNDRCNNPNSNSYHRYGGRGIKLIYDDITMFLSDVGNRPTPNHSIDRIDNNGHYESGNCRWATKHEQANNTRNNRFMTLDGKTMTLSQWAHSHDIPVTTLFNRLKRGVTLKRALIQR